MRTRPVHTDYVLSVPVMELHCLVSMLESVQRRAARWINNRYDPDMCKWTKNSDVCLKELDFPSGTGGCIITTWQFS